MNAPRQADGRETLDLRQAVDALCDRFEEAWQQGRKPDLAAFVPPADPLRQEALPELILVDLEYRFRSDEQPSSHDYLTPYPELGRNPETMRRLLDLETKLRAQRQIDSSMEAGSTVTLATGGKVSPKEHSVSFLAPSQAKDELGRLGSYRVLKILGAGGMGVVFLADDPRLKRRVALKVIKSDLVQRPEVRARFLREAQAIAQVEHENIVTILHIDEARGVPFLTMPLLRGESLEDRLRRTPGPLPIDETLRIGREIASGLAAAHKLGLVHRDIKPANVFLATAASLASAGDAPTPDLAMPEGTAATDQSPATADADLYKVKILDFGLARAVRSDESDLSQPGTIVGTPAYMAPEQGRGFEVDHRTDLFSLGCVLYRMATGQPPFRGADPLSTLMSVACDTPTPSLVLNPQLPPALVRLIDLLLAKSPNDRPQSALAVVEAIQAIERSRIPTTQPPRTRRAALVLAGAALLIGSALTAWLVSSLRTAPVPPVPPPEDPGAVLFALDEPGVTLAVRSGDEAEKIIDPKDGRKVSLPPGVYQLRTVEKSEGRELKPNQVVVKSGETQTLTLRLVGELRNTGPQHSASAQCVAQVPRPGPLTILSASLDTFLGVWTPLAPPPQDEVKFLSVEPKPIHYHALAVAPDGNLAAAGGGNPNPRLRDFSIHLWDLTSRTDVGQLAGHERDVHALAFSPDGKQLLSGDLASVVYLWDVKERKGKQWKPGQHNPVDGVHAVAFSADGKQALTGGGDKLAILWDVQTGEPLKTLADHGGKVRGVVFGPGANEAATACDDGLIRIWDLTGDAVRKLDHKCPVLSLARSPDGKRLLSAGKDGTLRLWDAGTGEQIYVFKAGEQAVNCVAFTADGRRAISGGADHTIRLWELPY